MEKEQYENSYEKELILSYFQNQIVVLEIKPNYATKK